MSNSLIEPPFIPSWAKNYKESVFFIYNGPSMRPLFRVGDLLCVRKTDLRSIRLGDIVVVDWGTNEQTKEYVVHRVISFRREFLVTQGDNNFEHDLQTVNSGNLVGVVISFSRQNHLHVVHGGILGFLYARLFWIGKYLWFIARRLGWRIYQYIKKKNWVSWFWHPVIHKIYLMTKDGPIIKYCVKNRTVAHWLPNTNRFMVIKPFDLVIPRPEEI